MLGKEVKSTKSYDKFHDIAGNRDIIGTHLSRLMVSIKERNLLEHNPIIVTEDFGVIDGQHRLKAAEKLDIPIYYVVFEGGDLRDIQLLNYIMKKWSILDFINSYIATGNKEYEELKSFADGNNLPYVAAAELLDEGAAKKFGITSGKIKDGSFKVTSKEFAENVVEKISMLEPYVRERDRSLLRNRFFLRAVRRVYEMGIKEDKDYFDRIVDILSKTNRYIPKYASVVDYLREFESLYNYNMGVDNKERFY